jgi:lipoprotein-anchoring transpeptidase ErfK/SrfK
MRRAAALALVALAAAGCGSGARHAARATTVFTSTGGVLAAPPPRCLAGAERSLVTAAHSYAALAPHGVAVYTHPRGRILTRFGKVNVNDYPTILGVLAERVDRSCEAAWFHVELPIRPNGASGWVRAGDVTLADVPTRIVVSVSRRRLTLFQNGRRVLRATVAVGSPSTPTPTGRYYVNQLLVPDDPDGPFGPGAVGVSAFSNVLTGWTQGGPIAIHGTNEPWSIGHAVSNGCIRLPNATLRRVFRLAAAGTPVIILP